MQASVRSSFILRRTALAGLFAGVLALGGCAALQPQTAEQIVAQRAEERWNALIARDFDKAWTYTQPAYRAIVKQGDYRNTFGIGGKWLGMQVIRVQCEPERCIARLRVTSRVTVSPFRNQELAGAIDETWVREDGQWWYFQAF